MQNESTGAFGSGSSDTAYSILALRSADVPLQDPALQRAEDSLEASQLPSGGFEYSPGFGEDSNTLSIAIIALKGMQTFDEHTTSALAALKSFQNTTNGGFFYQSMWGTKPDVSSTSLGIQAIVASGDSPTQPPWASGGGNPFYYLLATQNWTTGEFYDPWGSLRPTSMAIPALLGRLTPGAKIGELLGIDALLAVVMLLVGVGARRE